MSNTTKFSSEGFDLDALASSTAAISTDDASPLSTAVVYEIGGGVTVDATAQKQNGNDAEKVESKAKKPVSVMDQADEAKEQGNAAFKDGNWLEAYDCYTAAIDATPAGSDGLTGEQLLKLRDEWREEQIKEQRRRLDRQEEERRKKQLQKRQAEKNKNSNDDSVDNKNKDKADEDDDQEEDEEEKQKSAAAAAATPPRFEPPPHVHGTKLAVFYANRAATLLHLQRYEAAVRDCDVAILYNPVYTKAYLRRASAHESLQQTEDALLDAKSALAVSTDGAAERGRIQKLVSRLQKMEDERLEKLKAETMDKLKDLGNSILGNFGLSLDNFQTVQDPKTGSYSISFNQGNNNNNNKS
jgi:tetratricopeptide (TPR) repeat protein